MTQDLLYGDNTAQDVIRDAIECVEEYSSIPTDGKWLEHLIVKVGVYIKDWDIEACYLWDDWPCRPPEFIGRDRGIDVVAKRRSDGKYIAIQSKARQLGEHGKGGDISAKEVDSFICASDKAIWAERWLVTNGNNPLNKNAQRKATALGKRLKVINIHKDLGDQQASAAVSEECPHCQSHANEDAPSLQTKECMQREAVKESTRILREHVKVDSGGLPPGQARGKIILPCGTGKTRISLRIVEELTLPGELAVVLCPSIALIAQIRREYLQHNKDGLRTLAVCSDETAGYTPNVHETVDTATDPTADNSNVSESEVKGEVTTDSQRIAEWIEEGKKEAFINVIFGTYQSGHRIAEALDKSGTVVRTLVADEAHRTAGVRRIKGKHAEMYEKRIRNFTLCHDNDQFPAVYRIYQTASPKVFDQKRNQSGDWIVRSMDNENVFGVALYRKSYPEAVQNGWLSDYRIIALGVNDPEATMQADQMALEAKGSSSQYLRGLAFALSMGGATQGGGYGAVSIPSCIAFMNTVAASKDMAKSLQSGAVREWMRGWMHKNSNGLPVRHYQLEHLDATSTVTERDGAKQKLADGDEETPYGIINVGIFGEGTDAPSLSAVAFLEPRKSPIDVIQAVGRVMRTAPQKKLGYIICPILIPTNAETENWLCTSSPDEGWRELGQILLALRAHDHRIEDKLSELLYLHVPSEPEIIRTFVSIASEQEKRISHYEHEGAPNTAQKAVMRVVTKKSKPSNEFRSLNDPNAAYKTSEPTGIMTGRMLRNSESASPNSSDDTPPVQCEIRVDTVARYKPYSDGTPGAVNYEECKKKAKRMINNGEGLRLSTHKRKNSGADVSKGYRQLMISLDEMGEQGSAIKVNLLSKSGLRVNRIDRDLNILESSIQEAAYHLRSDEITSALNRHFGLDNLKPGSEKKLADGCTIAALLLMNAAMLHQRISEGRWIAGISPLSAIKNEANVVPKISREWERILRVDFHPIFDPAVEVIYAIEESGRTSGLESALRHIAAEAERIAETARRLPGRPSDT